MLDDLLKTPTPNSPPETLCAFGAGDYILRKEPEIVKKFRSKSMKKYKTAMILRAPKYRHLYASSDKNDRYFRHIDELKVDIQIAGDTIAILSLDHTSPIGLMIKHHDIANAFQQIFMEIWMRSDT